MGLRDRLKVRAAAGRSLGETVDMIICGVFALAVQVLVYFLVRKLLPHLNEQIPHDRCAPAVLVAAMSVAAGIVNAACLTY